MKIILTLTLLVLLTGCSCNHPNPDPWGRTFEDVIHENLRLQEELNSIYNKETKEEEDGIKFKATETIRPIEA